MSGLSAAEDVDISDVTSDGANANFLRRLRDNDPELIELQVGYTHDRYGNCYTIEDARGMGALGQYLGRSTRVTELILSLSERASSDVIEPFFGGLERNISIETLRLIDSYIPQDFFRMLTPFIKGNPNLVTFRVEECQMDAEQYRSLSLALREASRSLKHFFIGDFVWDGHFEHEESIIANIEALKMHPQLERIGFFGFTMGRNVCAALSDLLLQSAGVQKLDLSNNEIDDLGVEVLVDGLAHCRSLRELDLSGNPSITVRGWGVLSSLLEDPNSSLEWLSLQDSDINDERAAIFANALKNNSTLETLCLYSNVESTGEGRKAFSKVLCDTSSVNSTFLSNHTLQHVLDEGGNDLPDDFASLLALNEDDDKKKVAVKKVLLHHDDFDMQPLSEWDLKVLPFVIEWLERAAAYEIEYEADNRNRKLAAIYQFMRGMPELAIDGITAGVNKKSAQMLGEKRP